MGNFLSNIILKHPSKGRSLGKLKNTAYKDKTFGVVVCFKEYISQSNVAVG